MNLQNRSIENDNCNGENNQQSIVMEPCTDVSRVNKAAGDD